MIKKLIKMKIKRVQLREEEKYEKVGLP